jgi:hypothetical protein
MVGILLFQGVAMKVRDETDLFEGCGWEPLTHPSKMYASEFQALTDVESDEALMRGVFPYEDCPDRCAAPGMVGGVAQLWGQIVVRGSE